MGLSQCKKCKKKGHSSFKCPPKYDNKPIKHKNEVRYNKFKNKENENLRECAGMTCHYIPECWTCPNKSHCRPRSQMRNNLQNKIFSHFPHKRS